MRFEIIPYGEKAILINFDQIISKEINQMVHALDESLKEKKELLYTIPAYCSLLVVYKLPLGDVEELKNEFENTIRAISKSAMLTGTRHLRIPVCYHKDFGSDLERVGDLKKLKTEDIIRIHTSVSYMVFMMGFLPGFPYMGVVDPSLEMRRKETPEKLIHANSVAIAGKQTGIYPEASPGGWYVLGRTPLNLIREGNDPFLFRNGDEVRFYEISKEEFTEWEDRLTNKEKFLSPNKRWNK